MNRRTLGRSRLALSSRNLITSPLSVDQRQIIWLDLNRVEVYDLAAELERQADPEVALAGRRRADDCGNRAHVRAQACDLLTIITGQGA